MGRVNTARRIRPTVPSRMTVAQLREELRARGLDTTGAKAVLTARLKAAMDDVEAQKQQSILRTTHSAPNKSVPDSTPQISNQTSKESRPAQAFAAPAAENSEHPPQKEAPAASSTTIPAKTTPPAPVTSAPVTSTPNEEAAAQPSNVSTEVATGASLATEDVAAAKEAATSAKATSTEQCEDPMSEQRRRRRAERFGIEYKPFEGKEAPGKSESAKEEANGAENSTKRKLPDPADEEARQKRAERFGIVDKAKENKKAKPNPKVETPAAVPPDELERRAKRAKRFAMA